MKPLTQRVTMQDIADQLGISKVSVSKALAGQPGTSRALRERILKKAFELGYRGKPRAVLQSPPFNFCIVAAERFFFENEQFYTKLYLHLHQACTAQKLNLHLHVIHKTAESPRAFAASLAHGRYDGIFISGEIDEPYLEQLLGLRAPLVAMDFYRQNLPIDTIMVDNFIAGFTATTHLIERGHTRIGFLGDHRSTSSISDRYFGYLKALTLSKLPFHKRWHINENYEFNMFTHRFTLPKPLPTAFVCHCDSAAYQLMLILRGTGVAVPDGVSLVAFDNSECSRTSSPKITTIDINKREISERALEQMLWRLSHRSAKPQRIELATRLIPRQTVKALAPHRKGHA
jgi:LacI family transcriptional regulator